MDRKILSALIGLVGAIGNNGKTNGSDAAIRGALLSTDSETWVERIHTEKNQISPNCAYCKTPCGNTSDYPMEGFDRWSEKRRVLIDSMFAEMQRIAGAAGAEELPEVLYKAISYIGYDLEDASLIKVLEEMKTW